MPKIKAKTHKGAKKRFRVTANGKVIHKRCGSSHLMSHKSGKQVRRLRKKSALKVEADAKRFRRALLSKAHPERPEAEAEAAAGPETTATEPAAGQ